MVKQTKTLLTFTALAVLPAGVSASLLTGSSHDFTNHWIGQFSLAVFFCALLVAILEEFTHLRKSKPVILSAGIIWGLIGWSSQVLPEIQNAEQAVRQNLLQYVELMLVMLVVMTYINAMSERQVFNTLRRWIMTKGYSYRKLYWISGLASFFLAPLLGNLAVALLAGATIMAIAGKNSRFLALGCTNIVLACNAGGTFSPFGDITTLMVWQAPIHPTDQMLDFWSFFQLFPSALVAYLIPAVGMHFAVPARAPKTDSCRATPRRGAKRVILLFFATILSAIMFRGLFELPAVVGMLTGLAYLQFFGYYLKKTHGKSEPVTIDEEQMGGIVPLEGKNPFDIFARIARSEWDTLFFIYGVALSVGGLAYLGYLALASDVFYGQWGATYANIILGLLSGGLENVPIMYGVLGMAPEMSHAQWLLATFCTGVGGSLLSIGSVAGIALMGEARNHYTFFYHLRWTPLVLIGYACGIGVHLLLHQSAL